jgi:hypothetical protein
LPEFDREDPAVLVGDEQPDNVQMTEAEPADGGLSQLNVDETVIAVPQNDVKLKS